MTEYLQIAKRGQLTLPKSLRDRYALREGETMHLIDLGGTFLLSPGRSALDEAARELSHELQKSGTSLDHMLNCLREERESYGKRPAPVR
jgi:bifunctional DNA-binding transcriptional regulator/antitoxin component of YhaV-PrlF toxin-antitoxin module